MAYPISDVTRRVVYTGSAGVGPYSFSFEVLANTDIEVYKNTTLLTLTTDYSVTINANGTGSVTLVSAATGSDNITLVGARAIERTTDFVTGGDLFANTLNDEFDSLVIFAQQIDEKADRGLKAPVTDPTDVNMTLPVKATRKGTVLAFNATSGNPEAGPSIASVETVANQSANINTVAGSISNVNTVATNISNVNTVAGVSGNVTTVAGSIANVNTVADDLNEPVSEINTVAVNITNVNSVGNSITNVNTVATNISAVNTNATNITAIQNAASNAASAASSASSASTSASNAATSESNALTYKNSANTSASNAATSATNAASSASSASSSASTASTQASNAASSASSASTSASNAASSASTASTQASNAATSATNAASSATSAATSATNAQSAADSALAALDSFDDRYLGQKTSDPTLDNDGNALVAGALYFNTTSSVMKVYEGSVWVAAYASLSGALLVANNLSDVASTTSARTNLGLGSLATASSINNAYWSGTDLTIANGGTGASDAATALTNLGAYAASNPNGYTSNTGTVTSVTGGSYLTGGTITTSGTLAVDATSANTASKVVARDASGNFSAGTITASLSGNATTATTATSATSATTATTATNLAGGGAGQVPYQSASGTTAMLAAGTAGQVLQSNGAAAPSWITPSSGGVTSLNGQTGAITDTTLYAIGSYVNGRPQNATNYTVNSTIAGSSLYAASSGCSLLLDCGTWTWTNTRVGGNQTLVNTGSWRCVSPAPGNGSSIAESGLWVRYA